MLHLFGRHRHLSQRVLSEYLDQVLPDSARRRAGRALAACDVCKQELESLSAVVSLLRQAPPVAPRRSFTWSAPPPPAGRASLLLRLPNWTYAGAASMAALVLAVVVSADAAGILAPQERAAIQTESFMAAPPSQEPAVQGTPSPEGDPARNMKSAEPGRQAPEASGTATFRDDAGSPPSPTSQPIPAAGLAAPGSPPGPAGAAGPAGPAGPLPGVGLVAESTSGATELTMAYDADPSPATTPWFWRALEVLAAVAALGFLLGLLVKHRRAQR